MNNNIVSIVVPIYNSADRLDRCLQSLIKQDYQEVEIILINDGSTDKSGQICDLYASSDDRIKVIHQKNKGPSNARNTGLKVATGKYIQFVDSDDHVETNMVSSLVRDMQNNDVDLVFSAYKNIYANNQVVKSKPLAESNLSKEVFLHKFYLYFEAYYINYLWNKLYKSSIIKNKNITFDGEISWGEDLVFNISYFQECESFFFSPKYLYNYSQDNLHSITSKFNSNLFDYQKKMYTTVKEYLSASQAFNNENKKIFWQKYHDAILLCVDNLFRAEPKLSYNKLKREISHIVSDNMSKECAKRLEEHEFKRKYESYYIGKESLWLLIVYKKLSVFTRSWIIFRIFRKIKREIIIVFKQA